MGNLDSGDGNESADAEVSDLDRDNGVEEAGGGANRPGRGLGAASRVRSRLADAASRARSSEFGERAASKASAASSAAVAGARTAAPHLGRVMDSGREVLAHTKDAVKSRRDVDHGSDGSEVVGTLAANPDSSESSDSGDVSLGQVSRPPASPPESGLSASSPMALPQLPAVRARTTAAVGVLTGKGVRNVRHGAKDMLARDPAAFTRAGGVNPGRAWLYWLLLGPFGVHRFYVKSTRSGLIRLAIGLLGFIVAFAALAYGVTRVTTLVNDFSTNDSMDEWALTIFRVSKLPSVPGRVATVVLVALLFVLSLWLSDLLFMSRMIHTRNKRALIQLGLLTRDEIDREASASAVRREPLPPAQIQGMDGSWRSREP